MRARGRSRAMCSRAAPRFRRAATRSPARRHARIAARHVTTRLIVAAACHRTASAGGDEVVHALGAMGGRGLDRRGRGDEVLRASRSGARSRRGGARARRGGRRRRSRRSCRSLR
jgi:hypothetical protein